MRFGPASPGPLLLTIDGESHTLHVPADGRVLAAIAASGQWPRIIPGLLDDTAREQIEARLRAPHDRLDWYACWRIIIGLAPELYGVEWWAAQRLCALAQERWRDWSTWCVKRGLDTDTASAHRIVSAAWGWLLDGVQEEKDLHKLERHIFDPPAVMLRTKTAVPKGFSEAELAEQARMLAALPNDGSDG